jgi:hypothetical protein
MEQLFPLAGLVISFIAGLWAVAKFLLGRIDTAKDACDAVVTKHKEYTDKSFSDVYTHINQMKDTFARREDLHTHASTIEKGIGSINARLDNLFTLLITNNKKEK